MANKKPNWAAWVLRLVGSLAFLAVVWQLWQGYAAVGAVANVFAPLLFGVAVALSIVTFLAVLAELIKLGTTGDWVWKDVLWTGIALFALVVMVPGVWVTSAVVVLVGFVLSVVGLGWAGR